MFPDRLQKDLFNGKWSLAKSYFKESYCHDCHTRFALFVPLPSYCVRSALYPWGLKTSLKRYNQLKNSIIRQHFPLSYLKSLSVFHVFQLVPLWQLKEYIIASVTTPDKTCWDKSQKCLFFLSSRQKLKPPPNECPISPLPLAKVD